MFEFGMRNVELLPIGAFWKFGFKDYRLWELTDLDFELIARLIRLKVNDIALIFVFLNLLI